MDNREVAQLEDAIGRMWDMARDFGLDPFPVRFEVVPATIMYEFGAYGLPGRFSHWTHGKAFHQLKTMYDYGLSKIYELVINTNPAYGFLLETNSMLQNKLVVAHVFAHSDFFKNNAYFRETSRQMLEGASISASRIRQYEFENGAKEVELFLDAVLSIQEHVDPQQALRRRGRGNDGHGREQGKPHVSPYEDILSLGESKEPEKPPLLKVPPKPQKDLLLFLAEHSPVLRDWQRDIIHIVRQEMLYFYPQIQTKIMNEGWASYWHARILRDMDLTGSEYIEFASLHSGVLAGSKRRLNPYQLGLKIFEDIERRWDNPTEDERERLGHKGGEGRRKMFEVREMESDVSFIRNYLTKDLVEELDLYLYEERDGEMVIVEKDWEKIRDMLVGSMTNQGFPYIMVEDGDYRGNLELYLRHYYDGRPLDLTHADRVLGHLYTIWGRPVHLETVLDDKPTLLSYDGQEAKHETLKAA
ncbi:MAG: SpoVR family protein [Dehalococcoidia bacterium]|nr:SpoVR family protein [Dehalococcoidia bacterium]